MSFVICHQNCFSSSDFHVVLSCWLEGSLESLPSLPLVLFTICIPKSCKTFSSYFMLFSAGLWVKATETVKFFRWFCSLLRINKLPQLLNFLRGWECEQLINKDFGPQLSILWEARVSFTAKSACQKRYLTASTALSPLHTLICTLYSTLSSIRHKVLCPSLLTDQKGYNQPLLLWRPWTEELIWLSDMLKKFSR